MLLRAALLVVLATFLLVSNVAGSQNFERVDQQSIDNAIAELTPSYGDVLPSVDCKPNATGVEAIICASQYLRRAELLYTRSWAYAVENATKSEVDRRVFRAPLPDACNDDQCIYNFFAEQTNAALGSRSPFPVAQIAERGMRSSRGRVVVPVMAGGDPDFDACPSTGSIVGLDPQGDGFLSVRSGPGGSKYREIDRVFNGMHVWICGKSGPWYAVVYSTERGLDCNVASPWTRRENYTGPCDYGWVHSRYVGDLAG